MLTKAYDIPHRDTALLLQVARQHAHDNSIELEPKQVKDGHLRKALTWKEFEYLTLE